LFFWFKKKEIVLDCFTDSQSVYEFAKPDFAYKFFPDWYLELKKTAVHKGIERRTIKNCQGFRRYYAANTIILPFPGMVTIDLGTNKNPYYSYISNDDKISISEHLNVQFNKTLNNEYADLKFKIPWYFKTNKFIEFFWSDPVWNRNNILDYSVLPAIVDYKYQFATEVNFIVKYGDVKKTLNFTMGEPLVMLAPLSECNIKIKHHIIDTAKYNSLVGFTASNKQAYKLKQEIIQAADKRDAMKKCPFHLR